MHCRTSLSVHCEPLLSACSCERVGSGKPSTNWHSTMGSSRVPLLPSMTRASRRSAAKKASGASPPSSSRCLNLVYASAGDIPNADCRAVFIRAASLRMAASICEYTSYAAPSKNNGSTLAWSCSLVSVCSSQTISKRSSQATTSPSPLNRLTASINFIIVTIACKSNARLSSEYVVYCTKPTINVPLSEDAVTH